jgi:hypothetical protein
MSSNTQRIKFFCYLITGILASSGCNQIQTIFPGSVTPPPEKVEETRIKRYSSMLPSFKPMQFAWFYKPPDDPDELSIVASNFSFFIFTRNDEPEIGRLAENGAVGDVLQYLRFDAVMDPGDCQTKPLQNQTANLEGDFCIIRDQHQDWFLLDINEKPIKLSENGYMMMDPGNPGWNTYFLEKVSGFQKDPIWKGVFLDNVDASLGRFDSQSILTKRYPDDKSFQDAVAGNLAVLSDELHRNQKTLIANITFLRQPETWFSYLAHLDGAMLEAFAVDWDDGYISEAEWLNQLDIAEATQAQGKTIILVAQGDSDNKNRMLFGLASFLLINEGNAYFRYSNDEAYRKVWWYPEFELDLGQPLGPRYKENNVWRRDFEKGRVTVDPLKHRAEIVLD